MLCPRCSFKMENIVEYVTEEEEAFLYSKEYFCGKCKCCVIERFDQIGLKGSEWIDFNV